METIDDLIQAGQVRHPSRDILQQARTVLEAQIVLSNTPSIGKKGRAPQRQSRIILAVGSVAAVAVALAVTISNVGEKPNVAAAAVLDHAAQAAASLPTLAALTPGQYHYEKTVSLQSCSFSLPNTGGTQTQIVYLSNIVTQTWTSSNGSGIEKTAPQGSGQFPTSEEQSLWSKSGQPNTCIQTGATISLPPSSSSDPGVTMLPTNPTTLGSLIASGRVNDAGQVSSASTGLCPSQNGDSNQIFVQGQICNVAAQFDIVNNLLSLPTAPLILGPVLYHVLAQLPGVEVIGSQTDAVGRTGTAIEDPSSGDVVVLDPATGQLLETETLATTETASPGEPVGTVLQSATYAADGVANALGSDPS